MPDLLLTLVTFVAGCLVGWFTNHWYAVRIRMPSLKITGSGAGVDPNRSGYFCTNISVTNEPRALMLRLPEIVILGKRLRREFGSQIIDRDPARQCQARLLDMSREHVCHLWWSNGTNVSSELEIQSGEHVNILVFVRKDDDSGEYFVYEPTSQSDFAPKTSNVARFDTTREFILEISYSYGSRKTEVLAKMTRNPDGSFYFKVDTGTSMSSTRVG